MQLNQNWNKRTATMRNMFVIIFQDDFIDDVDNSNS